MWIDALWVFLKMILCLINVGLQNRYVTYQLQNHYVDGVENFEEKAPSWGC